MPEFTPEDDKRLSEAWDETRKKLGREKKELIFPSEEERAVMQEFLDIKKTNERIGGKTSRIENYIGIIDI